MRLRSAGHEDNRGLIVLPSGHRLVRRRELPEGAWHRIGKSAYDQCSYCTEMCSRYLPGYDVRPHNVMRGPSFTVTGTDQWNKWADLCCECGLCTQYACPEDLFPKEACDRAIADRKAAKIPRRLGPTQDVRVHPMQDRRHVPLKALIRKLDLAEFDRPAPWMDHTWRVRTVTIRLQQHLGVPSVPAGGPGNAVDEGQLIADVPEGTHGARVHASIGGTVTNVTADAIIIEAR